MADVASAPDEVDAQRSQAQLPVNAVDDGGCVATVEAAPPRRRPSMVHIMPSISGGVFGMRARRARSRDVLVMVEEEGQPCRHPSIAWLVPSCFFLNFVLMSPIAFLQEELVRHEGVDASVIMAVFISFRGILSVAISPWLGGLSDRCGRRPVLAFKAALCTLWTVPMACLPKSFTPRLTISLALLTVQGLTGSNFGTFFAYCGDLVLAGRARSMNEAVASLLATSFTPAVILGPPAASLCHHLSGGPLMWRGFLAVGVLNTLYTWLALPESIRIHADTPTAGSPVAMRRSISAEQLSLNPFRSFRLLSRQGPAGGIAAVVLRRILLTLFLLYFAKWSLLSIAPLYAQERLGWPAEKSGLLLTAWGFSQFSTFVVLMAFTRRAREAGHESRERCIAWIGLIAGLLGMVLMACSRGGWGPFPAMIVGAVSMVTYTALTSYSACVADPSLAGELQGLVSVTLDMSEVAGPPVFGWLLRWGMLHIEVSPWLPNASFAVGILSVIAAMVTMHTLPTVEDTKARIGEENDRAAAFVLED